MIGLKSFFSKKPVMSGISITIIWFILLMLIAALTSSLLNKEFGNPIVTTISHSIIIICILILTWRLGWLKAAGFSRQGSYKAWLIGIVGTIYFTFASLYSFYGKLSLDLSNLIDLSISGNSIMQGIANCLSEEMLFRGIVLYIFVRSWGETSRGRMGSVAIMSGIFALFHILHVFFWGSSPISAILLVLETFIISVWWASLVIMSGSIWPAFLAHFVVNTIVAIQGQTETMVQPETHVYLLLLLFSIPLGIYGSWAISRTTNHNQQVSDMKI